MVKKIHKIVNSIQLKNGNLYGKIMSSNPIFDKPTPAFDRCNHRQFFNLDIFYIYLMLKPKFLLTLLLYTVLSVQASAGNVDSLKNLLKNNIHDTTKCRLLLEITNLSEMQEIPIYSNQVIDICGKNLTKPGVFSKIYKKFKVEALLNLAIHYRHAGEILRSGQIYDTVYAIVSDMNDKILLAMYRGNLASYFKHIGRIDEAIKENFAALKIYEAQLLSPIQKIELATLYNNIGVLYHQQNEVQLAIRYTLKAIETANIPGLENNQIVFMINAGSYYISYGEDSLALNMYQRALQLSRETVVRSVHLSNIYDKIGLYHYKKSDYQLAEVYYDSAFYISNKSGDIDMKGIVLRDKAMLALKKKQYNQALNLANQALEISLSSGNKETTMMVERVLYFIYREQKQFQFALNHYQRYIDLRDTINNSKNTNSLEKAKLSYEFEKKILTDSLQHVAVQRENTIKLEQKELSLETERKIRVAVISISALALIIGVLLFSRRLLAFKTRQRQLELNNLQISYNLLRAQMNPHFLFNAFNSIQSFITGNDPVKAEKFLIKFSRLMRSVLEYTSKTKIYISEEINALTDYIELEQLRLNNKFQFKIIQSDNLAVLGFIPPMLIQPFVENAILHGLRHKTSPGHLIIKFSSVDNLLRCEIIDDGVGRKRSAQINSLKSIHHSSKGMEITLQRLMQLRNLNNKTGVFIEDLYDSLGATGTKVILSIPFTNSEL